MFLAYLDAGSGSLILQAILGGAAGIAVAFKAWRSKLATAKAAGDTASDQSDEPANTDI
jgi:hypothetical protein